MQRALDASLEASSSRVSSGGSDILALKVGQEIGVTARKCARASKAVNLASVAEIGRADSVGRSARAGEELAGEAGGLEGSNNVLEDITFSNDLATGANLESVAGVVIPVVVDSVEESVSTDLRGTAGRLVDVVVLEGNGLGDTLGNIKALALDNTLATDADKTLIRTNNNRVQRSLVIFNADLGGVGLVVVAPAVFIDSDLAGGSCAVRSAASLGRGALSASEVKGSVQNDNSSR
ncbi:hypothetical protein HG530_004086 [Fusarium avenaceum]|nr:hypothetical protein HG530_004086 [Fusarium avenaceum]